MAAYVVEFAKQKELFYQIDEMHNVLVRKPASRGYEQAAPVLLEGHMDMVTIKTPESKHNFETDPIELVVEGDWVRGNQTTLGADNGCAVALMLALLDDDTLLHPPLECLFTVQEETGLHGVKGFDVGLLRARRVIGLDAGSEGVFRKGVSSKYINWFSLPVQREYTSGERCEIIVSGLRGGHASVAIPLDRACAIKLMGRVLHYADASLDIRLVRVDKSVNRGVAEDCVAELVSQNGTTDALRSLLAQQEEKLRKEYAESEPDIRITLRPTGVGELQPMSREASHQVIEALYLMPFGAERRVLARQDEPRCYVTTKYVMTTEANVSIHVLISTDYRPIGIAKQDEVKAFFALLGGAVTEEAFEFGWNPEAHSPIRETMKAAYLELFGKEPIINVSHGGNDCVVIKERIPEFDVVTTAATYLDYHTPNERLNMISFERVYQLLCRTLENLRV